MNLNKWKKKQQDKHRLNSKEVEAPELLVTNRQEESQEMAHLQIRQRITCLGSKVLTSLKKAHVGKHTNMALTKANLKIMESQ